MTSRLAAVTMMPRVLISAWCPLSRSRILEQIADY